MAVVSSHILNGVDGTHAGGIKVHLINLNTGNVLFDAATDAGGRLKQEVANPDPKARYELVFQTGSYWDAQGGVTTRTPEVILRFAMPEVDGSYHSPIILSPNGYSVWTSS